MRSWQIIIGGIGAASVGAGLVLLPGVLPWHPGAARLLFAYWPAILVVWLGLYGIAALALNATTAFLEINRGADGPDEYAWATRYFARLAVAQYFTAIIALLALGLSHLQIDVPAIFFLPASVTGAPALAAAGVVALVGLLGWLCLATAALFHRPATSLPVVESPELRLLREIRELLRSQRRNPVSDPVALVQLMEQGQVSILEAIKDLATAVNRARRGLGEIRAVIQDRGSERAADGGASLSGEFETTVAELRAAVTALEVLVTRLGQTPAPETPLVPSRDSSSSLAGSQSHLSTQLRALLQEMASSTAPPESG